jgi:hypothetical protein
MTMGTGGERRGGGRGTFAVWGGAGLLLLAPWAAMQVTGEVNWDLADFVLLGVLLAGACGAYELATRTTGSWSYRLGVGVAAVTAVLLILVNLAVGFIGSEDDTANLVFAGVLAIGAVGAVVGRFRPRGMALAMAATGLAQASVAAVGLAVGWDVPLAPTAVFTTLWLGAAWLFHKAQGAGAR